MKKYIITIILLIFILFIPSQINKVNAQEYKSFDIINISNSQYDFAFKGMNATTDLSDATYIGQKLSNYIIFVKKDFKNNVPVVLTYAWESPDYIIVAGEQYVNLLLTDYETKEVITCKVYIYGIEKPKNNVPTPTPIPMYNDEDVQKLINSCKPKTSLTATTLMLVSTSSSYDINLTDKDENSSYKWTSDNEKVAKVNSKGVVTAVNDGTAIITCTETASDGTETKLESTVKVGQDDNFPTLSDDSLDLSVNDTYDLDVENGIKGSSIKFKSSDKLILKVNSSTGKVTAVGTGIANVICTIKKGTEIVVLVCEVEVSK